MLGLFLAHVLGYYSSNSVTNLVKAMLDFFKDIFASFRQSSLERIKSPFLGAFVFSWVGFNWQMLAILFMSKQSIICRIDYINSHFDIGNYLLGPISTTILICLILPLANKHITKLQKATNQDTNELILQSKIDIAEKQVELADYDAKKKLAEEREKKNIESNIAFILKENKRLTELSDSQKDELTLSQINIEKHLDNESFLKEKVNELELTIQHIKSQSKSLMDQLKEVTEHKNKYDNFLVSELKNDKIALTKKNEDLEKHNRNLSEILSSAENKSYGVKQRLAAILDYRHPVTGETIEGALNEDLFKMSQEIFQLLNTFASHPNQE